MSSIESVSTESRVFPPSEATVKKATISGMAAYEALCKEAETDYEGYWARLARELISWKTPFTKVLGSDNAPFFRWFEDGTLNYLSIPAVETGLRHLQRVGIETIGTRVQCLTGWLIRRLLALKHGNGRPMVRLYGPANLTMRGGTLTMNFYDPEGHLVDYRRVEELAAQARISLRTGCFCNPGAGEVALGISRVELDVCFTRPGNEDRLSIDDFRLCIDGKSSGAVRISVGPFTNFNDVQALLSFARGLLS